MRLRTPEKRHVVISAGLLFLEERNKIPGDKCLLISIDDCLVSHVLKERIEDLIKQMDLLSGQLNRKDNQITIA